MASNSVKTMQGRRNASVCGVLVKRGLPLLAAMAVAPAMAGNGPWLFGDQDGTRGNLKERGFDFDISLHDETMRNLDGGERKTTRSAGQINFGATLDLERLMNWKGGTFQVTMDKRYGDNLADKASLGTAMGPHEIWGRGQTWWLTNFYLDQQFGEHFNVRVGKMPMGSEFGFDKCDFLNLSACGSQIGNMEGRYWLNWPIGTWGARFRFDVNESAHVKLGVFQMNPNYTDDAWVQDNGWKVINPSGTTGAVIPLEFNWTPKFGGLAGDYRFGVWTSTAGGDDLYYNELGQPRGVVGGNALHRDRSHGGYISAQQQLTGDADGTGLHAFVNLGRADSSTARWNRQVSVGAVYRHLPWRPADNAGVLLASTAASEQYTRFAREYNAANPNDKIAVSAGTEKVLEVFYQWQPTSWLSLRPSVQYISRPGGRQGSDGDAVLLGLKTDVTF